MIDALTGILYECWKILAESAPYILFGFFAAGLLKALLPEQAIARHLGRSSLGAVVKASLFGIPLPLCSCGVIPAAIGLRRQGASKGASAAFLVSVPETGVDSIAITWALLDPIMTVVRPMAAFFTATFTGLVINRLPAEEPPAMPETGSGSGASTPWPPLVRRLRQGLDYAFGDLLRDIGKWLLLGIAVAGIIAWYVPDAFFTRYLENELLSLLLMLGIGIPMYICASASTPVAAAMVLKGLSPGAALVFLLAGPATNAATLTVVTRFWGKKATAAYLGSIAFCSLLLGWLTNRFYAWSGADLTRWVEQVGEEATAPWAIAAAVVLLILLARSFIPRRSSPCGCDSDQPGGT